MKTQFLSLVLPILAISLINTASAKSIKLTDMIELSVTGDPGQNFIGDCYLVSKTGTEKRHRIKGQVPVKFWLPARAARCNIQKSAAKGKLFATITRKGAKEFTQQSRYPFRWLSVSSAGPWGGARGCFSAARSSLKCKMVR